MSRRRVLLTRASYIAFVVAVVVFGVIGLRGRWGEIGAAMADLEAWRWLAAAALVAVGLVLTSFVWRRLMVCHGAEIPPLIASRTFFVGQLGKYIPGSLWSMGAQAEMARRHHVPVRSTVSAGLLFVGVNVASAGAVGSAAALLGGLDTEVPTGLFVAAAVVGPCALTPIALNAIGRRLAPSTHPMRADWRDSCAVAALMGATWLVYGAALWAVIPPPLGEPSGGSLTIVTTTAVFALAYAVGVVIVLAPAGVGAREATMAALLTPYIGVDRSVAAALVVRVLHTAADFAVAGVSGCLARRQGRRSGRSS